MPLQNGSVRYWATTTQVSKGFLSEKVSSMIGGAFSLARKLLGLGEGEGEAEFGIDEG